ncbi:MAG: nitroreductase family protein [Bacteroidales bacterium]|nr:nitroreductase family protein [Deltaproteobacteria bacterium]MBL7139228.1 nitroreductase family protein [Bacteroidales bacterium]
MNFLELVQKRQSCRAYDPTRPVEKEKLDRCIETVRLAPSACNSQPWKLVIVDDPELKNKIAAAADSRLLGFNHFAKDSPILVVVVREAPNLTSKIGTLLKDKPYTIMDVGIAAEHFCLQATSEGLGSCMMGWFDENKVKELLGIPMKKRAELIISLGYPLDDKLRKKIRKPVEEICSFNGY